MAQLGAGSKSHPKGIVAPFSELTATLFPAVATNVSKDPKRPPKSFGRSLSEKRAYQQTEAASQGNMFGPFLALVLRLRLRAVCIEAG